MKAVFADTAFFLALINPRDQHHNSAVKINVALRVPLVTTAWVLLEFANAVSASQYRDQFQTLRQALDLRSDASIIKPDAKLFELGCNLFCSRSDKHWSLTDCISFIVMGRHEITDALTSDRHFEQAGFRALLRHS